MAGSNLIKKSIIRLIILMVLAAIAAVVLGLLLTKVNNTENIEELIETNKPSLPSKLLDRNGELICEFYSDEKRDLVTLDAVPDFFIQALINWEDASFYTHHGFNLFAIIRATINNAMGKAVSGASTLTQQLSRTLFLNNEFSIKRKIKELWISMQLEKKYTKNEILSLYINHVPFGDGTNGVQAAAKQFFNKDVSEITYAEAASLITVISNPTFYSINKFPKNHRTKQREVLKKMVRCGIITELDMEKSYNEFWLAYQQSAKSTRGAFYNREDKAPYFSDWVLQEIRKELPSVNVFKDGLTIHTTLDLKAQLHAQSLMTEILDRQQKIYEEQQMRNYNEIQDTYMDTVALVSELFSLSNVNVDKDRDKGRAVTDFLNNVNPMLNLTCQILGLDLLETMTDSSLENKFEEESILAQVQGAFIALENESGKILCMIGGKKFDPNNRFNYAMQARRQPGSSFKPFVYSAALDSGLYTPATVFIDKPYVFTFDSDDPDDWYKPNNYGGAYYGKVSFRRALRKSLNIPACEIFYTIGRNNDYKVPIDRAAIMMGLISQKDINERFKREVSTVLGTGAVSPVEMARGFSVFANMGQKRVPNAIISVEDRDGRTIYEPWKELQKYYRENAKKLQVISEQNAYVMTDIMKDTVAHPDGMLYYRKRRMIAAGKNFPDVEIAAKTGTTQNFCDGWTVGYSPEITVAMWCGFKEYGLSLGNNQPGVTIHGNSFLDFMRVYHYNKGPMKFTEPDGIVHAKVCPESGLLPSESCNEENLVEEIFIKGTEPTRECSVCMLKGEQRHSTLDKFIDKYEMTRRPETQLFRDKVGYNKDIMKSAAKSEHGQNELSDVTLDIEGLNTVDLFEDDTFIDVDALLGTNKKKSNRSGRSSNRSSQNGSSNQNSRKSGSRGRRSSRGSSGTTTTTLYEMYQDPYEADAAADNEPEVDLDLNLDALLQEDFGDMLMTNDDEDKNETSVNDDIMTDNPVQDNTSDMMNGNNDLVIPNDTIVPLEENAPANNADNIGDMPAAAEPIAQDENGAAEPNPPDENIIPAAEQQTEQEHPAETVAEPEVHADNGAVPADNAEGEVKPEQNNANNEDFFLDL